VGTLSGAGGGGRGMVMDWGRTGGGNGICGVEWGNVPLGEKKTVLEMSGSGIKI
jgi:hypothetical protein